MKEDPTFDAIWSRLAARARRSAVSTEPAAEETAPFGFATQVVAHWQAARAFDQRLALWQRVSWRAALASMVACGALMASPFGKTSVSSPLLQPPPLPWPGLAGSTP